MTQAFTGAAYTLLEVLDAQASLTQARLREQEALQNFHIRLADRQISRPEGRHHASIRPDGPAGEA
jgi:hypothetical protein